MSSFYSKTYTWQFILLIPHCLYYTKYHTEIKGIQAKRIALARTATIKKLYRLTVTTSPGNRRAFLCLFLRRHWGRLWGILGQAAYGRELARAGLGAAKALRRHENAAVFAPRKPPGGAKKGPSLVFPN